MIDARRFRPNIVLEVPGRDIVKDAGAVEDRWQERFERLKPVYGELVARL